MVQVYSRALYDRYHASSSISLAGFFNLLCWAALILCPIFIAYASDGVWIRLRAYHDQPRMQFTRELIVEANGVVQTINQQNVIYQTQRSLAWSTVDPSLIEGAHYPAWKHSEIDENTDGIIDRIKGSVTFLFDQSRGVVPIHDLHVAFGVRMEISSRVRVSMVTAFFVDMNSALPGRGVLIQGNLNFQSINPINRIGHRAAYNQSLFDVGSDIASIKQRMAQRNDTIVISQPVFTWQPVAALSSAGSTSNAYTISYDLRTVPSIIWYVPDWSEELKQAWIQWVAFAALIGLALMIIRTIVYERRWIITTIIRDTLSIRKKIN